MGSANASTPFDWCDVQCTVAEDVTPPAEGVPAAAPISGVITRVVLRFRYVDTNCFQPASCPTSFSFRILSGTPPDLTARIASPTGTPFSVPGSNAANGSGGLRYEPVDARAHRVGVPIAAGERLALVAPPNIRIAADVVGAGALVLDGDHSSGLQTYGQIGDEEVQMQATVEPDADGDGYGDESQDNCPTIANDQTSRPCVQSQGPSAPPPPRGPSSPPPSTPVLPSGPSPQFAIVSVQADKHGAIHVALNAPGAGSFTAAAKATLPTRARLVASAGRKRKPQSRPIVYGRATATTTAAGPLTMTIHPSRRALAALRSVGRLHVAVTVGFQPDGGPFTQRTHHVIVTAPSKARRRRG
jgi:hypothetical protein